MAEGKALGVDEMIAKYEKRIRELEERVAYAEVASDPTVTRRVKQLVALVRTLAESLSDETKKQTEATVTEILKK